MFVIYDSLGKAYFVKCFWNNELQKYSALFQCELNSNIRTYPTKRKATAAINRVRDTGYEGWLEIVEITEELPTAPPLDNEDEPIINEEPEAEPEQAEPPPLRPVDETDADGWDIIDAVGTTKARTPYMLRKVTGDVQSYAIQTTDGGKFYLPGDELLAWERYCDERKRFICDRIRARRISEGKDPDGMDEWR